MPLRLYLFQIPNVNEAFLKDKISLIHIDLKKKITKHKFLKDQWHAMISSLSVKEILSKELKVSPNALNIELTPFGKPHLSNNQKYFNTSHSKNVSLLATDETPVGVDIEYMEKIKDYESLIPQFSELERKEFYLRDQAAQERFFYELWVLKESYVKAIGKGLSCPLQSFTIRMSNDIPSHNQCVEEDESWHFKKYSLFENYICAVCTKHTEFPKEPITIHVEELLGM